MHYAVSDIHGCYKEFIKLMDMIGFGEDDTLYVIGDVVDRGPEPVKLLSWMMKRPNVKTILGNHEYMMMKVLLPGLKEVDSVEAIEKTLTLDYIWDTNVWFFSDNGGKITADAFKQLSKYERQDLLDYVKSFSLYESVTINDKTFVMVHTIDDSIKSLKDLDEKEITDLEIFLTTHPTFEGEWNQDDIFIIGHTPTWFLGKKDNHIFMNGNLIDIDCACSMGGNLAALCLETGEEFYVKGGE